MKINNGVLVTIAIPIYNAERYLRFAIQSCINQTYKNWELLLMCDGSTDNSTCIAKEMAAKDSRIRVIEDGENRGLVFRLNQSVLLAKGELYARMDADDIMCVTRLEEQIKFFDEHPDADVVGTSIMTIDNENNIMGSRYYFGVVNSFVHPSVTGRTSWFLKNPYVSWATRAEDMELWLRTSRFSKFYAIGKPLLFYREFGVPTQTKYCMSQRTVILIASKYKDYGKSFSWFIKQTLLAVSKIILISFLKAFGKVDLMVSMRRAMPVPESKLLNTNDLMLSIKTN